MNYRLEVKPGAQRDIKSLPRQVQREVYQSHLPKIQADPSGVGEPLRGDLAGNWSYHFGHHPEYRILYTITGDLVAIRLVDTREGVYKKAKHRLT